MTTHSRGTHSWVPLLFFPGATMPERAARYARQRREFALILGVGWLVYGLLVVHTYPFDSAVLSWLPTGRVGSDVTGYYCALFGTVATASAYYAPGKPKLERIAYWTLTAAPLVIGTTLFLAAGFGYVQTGWVAGFRFIIFSAIAYYMAGLKPSNAEVEEGKRRHAHW